MPVFLPTYMINNYKQLYITSNYFLYIHKFDKIKTWCYYNTVIHTLRHWRVCSFLAFPANAMSKRFLRSLLALWFIRPINQNWHPNQNQQRKILPNLKITQTQKLELKTQIKTNQSNNNTNPLTKIDTQIRINKEKLPNLKITQTQH